MRSNHYDPDEDEEYYRKQLSYFDRRSFDSKAMGQPSPGINRFHDLPKPAQLSYPYNRYNNTPHVMWLYEVSKGFFFYSHTITTLVCVSLLQS